MSQITYQDVFKHKIDSYQPNFGFSHAASDTLFTLALASIEPRALPFILIPLAIALVEIRKSDKIDDEFQSKISNGFKNNS